MPLSSAILCLCLPAPQPQEPAPQQPTTQQPTTQQPTTQQPAPRSGRTTRGDEQPAKELLPGHTHLTGRWGGIRPWLEMRGIEPRLAMVTDASLVTSGGRDPGATAIRSLFDAECTFDGERLIGWSGTQLYFDLQIQQGTDGSRATGDYQVYSNIDGPDRVQLAQVFFEHTLLDGGLRYKLGKSDANSDFAYVEHGLRHIQSSFGFTPTVLGFPTYPDPAFGAAAFVEPGGNVHFGGGIYDGATQAGIATGPRGPRTLFAAPGDLFLVGEVGMHWHRDQRLPGHFGVGAWRHTGRFERSDGGTDRGTDGYYLVGDQMLWRPTERSDDRRGIGAFVQYGYADPEVSIVEHFLGGGATWTGPFEQRPKDACGIGIAAALWRDRPSETLRGVGEVAVELFYSVAVTQGVRLKPDLQYIHNPGGQPGVEDAWVVTLRLAIDF